MSLGDLKDWIMVSDTFNITALIIWIVRTIIYIFFIGIKQTVYIKPMITRVPVSISVGTRGTRELLMSLLVEALVTWIKRHLFKQFSVGLNTCPD